MFKLTASQIEAFSEAQVDRFVDKLLARLRQFFPDTRALSDEEVRGLIRHGIESAAVYDIISERDVAKYVGLMVLWGRDFDRTNSDAWVVSTLRDVALDPGYKLDLLYDHAVRGERPDE